MEEKNNRWEIAKPLSLALAVAFGMFFGWKITSDSPVLSKARNKNENVHNFDYSYEVLKYLRARYVDSLDYEQLNEVAVNAMMSQLDPYSAYLTPTEVDIINERMNGSYKGIGVEFYYLDDTLNIIRVLENSPADQVGLEVGDKLMELNGNSLLWNKEEGDQITQLLKSSKDSVEFNVLKNNQPINLTIVKDHISTPSVSKYGMLNDEVAYINIESFNSDTYRDFMLAVENLAVENKIDHLIIDVRNNPGGYLDAVVKIISQLFDEKDKMIVYTKSAGSNTVDYKTTGKSFFKIDKIAVLVNENSASASEILAGAVQDHDRGVVIGEKTYGKGMVQEQFKLSNKGAVRLTTSRFYTPSGRSIQKNELNTSAINNPNSAKDTIAVDTFLTANGRKVESGGGITPDIVISKEFAHTFNQAIEQNFEFIYKDIIRTFVQFDSKNSDLNAVAYMNKLDEYAQTYFSNTDELDLNILSILEEVGEEELWATYRKYMINLKFSDFESLKDLINEDEYIQSALSTLKGDRYQEVLSK